GGVASAQIQSQPNESTQVPNESRYEIVASPLAAKLTFRVDKFTGTVQQITQTKSGDLSWQLMPRLDHSLPDTIYPGRPNYQLFLSGIMLRTTFLMNINTVATWQLTEDSEKGITFWSPIR